MKSRPITIPYAMIVFFLLIINKPMDIDSHRCTHILSSFFLGGQANVSWQPLRWLHAFSSISNGLHLAWSGQAQSCWSSYFNWVIVLYFALVISTLKDSVLQTPGWYNELFLNASGVVKAGHVLIFRDKSQILSRSVHEDDCIVTEVQERVTRQESLCDM